MRMLVALGAGLALLVAAPACDKSNKDAPKAGDKAAKGEDKKADDKKADEPAKGPEKAEGPKADKGVDVATKTITMGALNDESGPAAAIGKPYAAGKRILAKVVNEGGSGFLPEGWKLELAEEDHGYNPNKALQAFNKIKDKVLFVGTSFGTPNTLPLRPHLDRETIATFPASLSSKMAEHKMTPPFGPGYNIEAMRAMDWIVESGGGKDAVKPAIVYQKDDYGADGLEGFKKAAEKHGVAIVSEQSVTPGQKDMAAVVTKLKEAGATHVLLTTLPSQTAPLLGTAAKMQFMPIWVGQTPSWIDAFMTGKLLPTAVFAKFHWVQGLPFWGEKVPGMDKFLAAYEKHGKELGPPDFYVLVSYMQGVAALEVAKRAIDKGDVTRAGYVAALNSLKDFDLGGMMQKVDLTKVPYVTATKTRVLKPDFENKTWTVAADYADPKAL